MKIIVLSIALILFGLIACKPTETAGTRNSVDSFELSRTSSDTINKIIHGMKQGLWLMPVSKDTVVYSNDTAYSVIAPMTSGEMIRKLKNGFHRGFKTYDSLAVKSN
jgi:hypothetical protein